MDDSKAKSAVPFNKWPWLKEAAIDLGVSRQTIARMIQDGTLIAKRGGRSKQRKRLRIQPESIQRYLEAQD